MKVFRIGNDIPIEWTILRGTAAEDFSDKDVSVKLYDKNNNEQTFDYYIADNVISGTFYGKDQSTLGVYRLCLVENDGTIDMNTLDYINCFCLSAKMSNHTCSGSDDDTNISTDTVEATSTIETNSTVDLSLYATINYVDNSIQTAVDEVGSLIPINVSELSNDAGYLTEHQSLSNYYTKSEIDDAGYLTEHQSLSNYYTKNEINGAGYLTEHQDISGKANVSDLAAVATTGDYNDLTNKPTIPTVPTNISSFTNDSGYLTASDLESIFVYDSETGILTMTI